MVSEIFFCDSMGVYGPQGMTNLNARGMVCRIYIGDHSTLLHTKHISCGPHGFREDFFLKNFPINGQFGPQGHGLQD